MNKVLPKNKILTPFIKWPGGKTHELPIILKNKPENFDRYIEPFLGGGSVYFSMGIKNSFVNDFSSELISIYKFIKERNLNFYHYLNQINHTWILLSNVVEEQRVFLIKLYNDFKVDFNLLDSNKHKSRYQNRIFQFILEIDDQLNGLMEDHFNVNIEHFIREIKRSIYSKMKRMVTLETKQGNLIQDDIFNNIETAFKAAYYTHFRYLYNYRNEPHELSDEFASAIYYFIREYCYSSMFRYNNKGKFNVPYGGLSYNKKNLQKKIEYIQSERLSDYLSHTEIYEEDFESFFNGIDITENDFIFLDPPYDSDFSTYAKNEFGKSDQERLAKFLVHTPAKFMLVIKNTDFIMNLYNDYNHINILPFDKTYMVSFKGRNDRDVEHLLIKNY